MYFVLHNLAIQSFGESNGTSKEVNELAYEKQISYLKGLKGSIDPCNRIYQELDGKRNIKEVDTFLREHCDNRLNG